MNRVERAIELHKSGYNCGQSVLCAFIDLFDIDYDTALRMSQPLGSGLGELRELCGAVNAMALVVGLIYGSSDASNKECKRHCYSITRQLCNAFQAENGSVVCRQLLGLDSSKDSKLKKRPCVDYVAQCASLLEKHLSGVEI